MAPASQTNKPAYGTTMSLRIWHPSTLGAEITRAIGLLPSLSNDYGSPRKTPVGQVLGGVYPQTYWLHKFGFPKDAEIEDCIVKAVVSLSPKYAFLKRISATGGRCELFVGMFLEKNAGIELNLDLVRQVADAGLGLSFDVFVPE